MAVVATVALARLRVLSWSLQTGHWTATQRSAVKVTVSQTDQKLKADDRNRMPWQTPRWFSVCNSFEREED